MTVSQLRRKADASQRRANRATEHARELREQADILEEERLYERVTLIPGASVFQDHVGCKWIPGAKQVVFEATWQSTGRCHLIAPGYGGKPYGSGSLYVNIKDVRKAK